MSIEEIAKHYHLDPSKIQDMEIEMSSGHSEIRFTTACGNVTTIRDGKLQKQRGWLKGDGFTLEFPGYDERFR